MLANGYSQKTPMQVLNFQNQWVFNQLPLPYVCQSRFTPIRGCPQAVSASPLVLILYFVSVRSQLHMGTWQNSRDDGSKLVGCCSLTVR